MLPLPLLLPLQSGLTTLSSSLARGLDLSCLSHLPVSNQVHPLTHSLTAWNTHQGREFPWPLTFLLHTRPAPVALACSLLTALRPSPQPHRCRTHGWALPFGPASHLTVLTVLSWGEHTRTALSELFPALTPTLPP